MCCQCVKENKCRKEFIVRWTNTPDMACKVARQIEEQGGEVISIVYQPRVPVNITDLSQPEYGVFAKCTCCVQVIGAVDRRHAEDRGDL